MKRTIVKTKANTRFNSILNVFIDSLKQKKVPLLLDFEVVAFEEIYRVWIFFLMKKRQVCWARSGIKLYMCFLFRLHTIRLKWDSPSWLYLTLIWSQSQKEPIYRLHCPGLVLSKTGQLGERWKAAQGSDLEPANNRSIMSILIRHILKFKS